MRKRTVRSGLRLVMASLVLIIIASFYHAQLSDLLLLSPSGESMVYRLGIFWAAAVGGYGVVLTAFGLVLSPLKNDSGVRILPVFLTVSLLMFLYFFLLSASFDAPDGDGQRRVRPGETVTI